MKTQGRQRKQKKVEMPDAGAPEVATNSRSLNLSEAQWHYVRNLIKSSFEQLLYDTPEAKFSKEMQLLLAMFGLEAEVEAMRQPFPDGWDRSLEGGVAQ